MSYCPSAMDLRPPPIVVELRPSFGAEMFGAEEAIAEEDHD